jgi:hypothetical protein
MGKAEVSGGVRGRSYRIRRNSEQNARHDG